MSLYGSPEEHAANPPETWRPVKKAERCWHLVDQQGTTIHYGKTKKECEAEAVDGFAARLWVKESAWYRGEAVPGWRPYAECKR